MNKFTAKKFAAGLFAVNPFVRLELKKILTGNSLAIGILFLIVILIPLFSFARIDVLDDGGNIHRDLGGWKILKERTAEGVMTAEFLFAMREHYRNSVDRPYIEGETADTERTLGLRLLYPQDQLHLILNFPYHTTANTMHNDFNLTDEQIEGFYENRRSGVAGYLSDETNGFHYTERQIELIADKMTDVRTPFVYKYSMGWQYLKLDLSWTFWFFFVFLTFLLANVFSRGHAKGIDQIMLSAKESRTGLPGRKIGAACIAATAAYGAYIGVILIFTGIVFSFHGWDASIQLGMNSFYSLNMLQDSLIHIFMGWFATMVVTHLILFLSMLLKRGKAVLALSVAYFYLVDKYQNSPDEAVQHVIACMPQNFVNALLDFNSRKLFFVGDAVLPYATVALFLGVLYIVFFRVAIGLLMKKYYLQ